MGGCPRVDRPLELRQRHVPVAVLGLEAARARAGLDHRLGLGPARIGRLRAARRAPPRRRGRTSPTARSAAWPASRPPRSCSPSPASRRGRRCGWAGKGHDGPIRIIKHGRMSLRRRGRRSSGSFAARRGPSCPRPSLSREGDHLDWPDALKRLADEREAVVGARRSRARFDALTRDHRDPPTSPTRRRTSSSTASPACAASTRASGRASTA